jgi:hypothetical protein
MILRPSPLRKYSTIFSSCFTERWHSVRAAWTHKKADKPAQEFALIFVGTIGGF